jgi:hypothetical protein
MAAAALVAGIVEAIVQIFFLGISATGIVAAIAASFGRHRRLVPTA